MELCYQLCVPPVFRDIVLFAQLRYYLCDKLLRMLFSLHEGFLIGDNVVYTSCGSPGGLRILIGGKRIHHYGSM